LVCTDLINAPSPHPQASGVTVSDECLKTYEELKLKRKHKWITFCLNKDNTEVIVHKLSSDETYETFLAELPEQECRWAVYDFAFEKEGAGKRNKICFISWYVPPPHARPSMVGLVFWGEIEADREIGHPTMRRSRIRWCMRRPRMRSEGLWWALRSRFRVRTIARSRTKAVRLPPPSPTPILG
jgi:hypothetical protein